MVCILGVEGCTNVRWLAIAVDQRLSRCVDWCQHQQESHESIWKEMWKLHCSSRSLGDSSFYFPPPSFPCFSTWTKRKRRGYWLKSKRNLKAHTNCTKSKPTAVITKPFRWGMVCLHTESERWYNFLKIQRKAGACPMLLGKALIFLSLSAFVQNSRAWDASAKPGAWKGWRLVY